VKTEEYKKVNRPSQQSIGLQITTQRIQLFNQQENGSIRITDLYDEQKQPEGTKVEIWLTDHS